MKLRDRLEQVSQDLFQVILDDPEVSELCKQVAYDRAKIDLEINLDKLETSDPDRYTLYWSEYVIAQSIVVSRILQLTLNAHLSPLSLK